MSDPLGNDQLTAPHTPRPWLVDARPRRDGESIYIHDANGEEIARVAGGRDGSESNAHLIAAAPDLLEVVRAGGRYSDALRRYQAKGVLGQVIPGTEELERLFKEWHHKGHTALDKAEGR